MKIKMNIAKEKETRDAEIASFKAVGDGIKDSIRNSQAQFAATIGRFDEQSALLKAINEAGQRVAEVLKSTVHSQRDEVQIEGVQLSQIARRETNHSLKPRFLFRQVCPIRPNCWVQPSTDQL